MLSAISRSSLLASRGTSCATANTTSLLARPDENSPPDYDCGMCACVPHGAKHDNVSLRHQRDETTCPPPPPPPGCVDHFAYADQWIIRLPARSFLLYKSLFTEKRQQHKTQQYKHCDTNKTGSSFSLSQKPPPTTQPRPAIGHYDAVSTFHDDDKRALHRLSGTHCRKLFSVVTLLLTVCAFWRRRPAVVSN